jgi:hypothetical protein
LNLGTPLLFALLVFRLAFGPIVIEVDPQWMIQNGWSAETATWYAEFARETVSPAVSIALKVGFFGTCIGAAAQFMGIVFGRRSSS